MNGFKAGDKVVRTGDCFEAVITGDAYTVVHTTSMGGLVLEGLGDFTYDEGEFEPDVWFDEARQSRLMKAIHKEGLQLTISHQKPPHVTL